MDHAWPIGTDRREEVLRLQTVHDIVKLLAISREEDRSRPRTISDTYHITLLEFRAVRSGVKGLVMSPVASGLVRNGRLVESCTKSISIERTVDYISPLATYLGA